MLDASNDDHDTELNMFTWLGMKARQEFAVRIK